MLHASFNVHLTDRLLSRYGISLGLMLGLILLTSGLFAEVLPTPLLSPISLSPFGLQFGREYVSPNRLVPRPLPDTPRFRLGVRFLYQNTLGTGNMFIANSFVMGNYKRMLGESLEAGVVVRRETDQFYLQGDISYSWGGIFLNITQTRPCLACYNGFLRFWSPLNHYNLALTGGYRIIQKSRLRLWVFGGLGAYKIEPTPEQEINGPHPNPYEILNALNNLPARYGINLRTGITWDLHPFFLQGEYEKSLTPFSSGMYYYGEWSPGSIHYHKWSFGIGVFFLQLKNLSWLK